MRMHNARNIHNARRSQDNKVWDPAEPEKKRRGNRVYYEGIQRELLTWKFLLVLEFTTFPLSLDQSRPMPPHPTSGLSMTNGTRRCNVWREAKGGKENVLFIPSSFRLLSLPLHVGRSM
ncbi:hypothetical protein VNO77_42004 [Canavalia gladiata]|uniref:Uncharacterized protein n=1 Tax=Canavalia gladiata TaxID=3824 RepID=A0AAN9JZW5_CANGL